MNIRSLIYIVGIIAFIVLSLYILKTIFENKSSSEIYKLIILAIIWYALFSFLVHLHAIV